MRRIVRPRFRCGNRNRRFPCHNYNRAMATAERLDTESTVDLIKRILVGRRMPTHRLEHTLLPKVLALPVFSSDALSSVAYATEQILFVLLAASANAAHLVCRLLLEKKKQETDHRTPERQHTPVVRPRFVAT